jgi:2-amino-4-hydroxy-6-hydroxymethyldihydropteridine diphosphokinase
MAEAVVALGGNVGDEDRIRATLDRAIAALCDGINVTLLARSSDYRTPPWGLTDQPPFINCVIIAATELSPPALLERAQSVETQFGRDRSRERHWGPRTIDIDLIDFDDMRMNTPALTLPHPHTLERAFVLLPLAEIAPGRSIGAVSIRDALSRLDRSGIAKLPPREPANRPNEASSRKI